MSRRPHPTPRRGRASGGAPMPTSGPARPTRPRSWPASSGHARLGPERRVLDLAAGTGKLTRLLVPSGADVVAVEPVAAMRDEMRAVLPDLEILDGTAEAIPLGDGSVDAVTVAQAVHWFDLERAVPEMLRVLRPGGALVLVWSLPDQRVDWIQRFTAAIDVGVGVPFQRYDVARLRRGDRRGRRCGPRRPRHLPVRVGPTVRCRAAGRSRRLRERRRRPRPRRAGCRPRWRRGARCDPPGSGRAPGVPVPVHDPRAVVATAADRTIAGGRSRLRAAGVVGGRAARPAVAAHP